MTSRKATKPSRIPRRAWLIFYRIDGRWQTDGEWFGREGAYSQARQNQRDHGWEYVVAGVDVPMGALRRMRAIDKKEWA